MKASPRDGNGADGSATLASKCFCARGAGARQQEGVQRGRDERQQAGKDQIGRPASRSMTGKIASPAS